MVTDQQVAILRQRRMEGKTQQTAAGMAGMSERSARKWQHGPLPSETKTGRRWRTRPDPFDGVWEEEILPLLRGEAAGRLRATTIIDWLEEKFPAGSAPRSCAPCNDDYRIGGLSTARTRRSTSPRSILRAARPSWTSPTATPWESPSAAGPIATCCFSWC